jgi:hypothetical protein
MHQNNKHVRPSAFICYNRPLVTSKSAYKGPPHTHTPTIACWGGLSDVNMFAHNKSGIAYRDSNQHPETDVDYRSGKHRQQPRLLPS